MTEDFWEQRYAATERPWSGRVNATMATTVEGLTPGRALDLGCGEGGDVLWLAAQGWEAHGIDISPTAVERGREQAQATGASATFEARDLAGW
ncbi:MAG: methyltransferase domain-containing protein, partial [Demequina sp.]